MTKKLLVLDLDETLIHATEEPLDHPAELQFGRCHVYLRPHLSDFIAGVQAHFHLALWTAGGELYARQIADHIFPEGALEFLWASQRCTLVRDWEEGGYQTRKRLKKIKGKGYPLASVIAVDDTPSNYIQSYGNLVTVRPFTGDRSDTELPLLLTYLITLKDVPNVRAVEKRNWRLKAAQQPTRSTSE